MDYGPWVSCDTAVVHLLWTPRLKFQVRSRNVSCSQPRRAAPFLTPSSGWGSHLTNQVHWTAAAARTASFPELRDLSTSTIPIDCQQTEDHRLNQEFLYCARTRPGPASYQVPDLQTVEFLGRGPPRSVVGVFRTDFCGSIVPTLCRHSKPSYEPILSSWRTDSGLEGLSMNTTRCR